MQIVLDVGCGPARDCLAHVRKGRHAAGDRQAGKWGLNVMLADSARAKLWKGKHAHLLQHAPVCIAPRPSPRLHTALHSACKVMSMHEYT